MRTLVTGGAGFIGSRLVQRLAASGEEVVVLDSLEAQVHAERPPELPEGVAFVHGDIGDPVVVGRALEGVDRVVHLAAAAGVGQSMYEIDRYLRTKTMATFLGHLLAMRPLPSRLVVASSMAIYGEGAYVCEEHGEVAPPPRPEPQLVERDWECKCPRCGRPLAPTATPEHKPLMPTSVYAVTKRDHEELCLVTGAAYGIPTVALRFFNVYGPGQALSNPYAGVAAIFASRLLNGREPIIFEDGAQSRDFIHVDDIVQGILLALESDDAVGRAVNLGTGRATKVAEIAQQLAGGLGTETLAVLLGQYRVGDIRHCYADPSLAEKVLGFRAAIDLGSGMQSLAASQSDQAAVDRRNEATDELVSSGLAR